VKTKEMTYDVTAVKMTEMTGKISVSIIVDLQESYSLIFDALKISVFSIFYPRTHIDMLSSNLCGQIIQRLNL